MPVGKKLSFVMPAYKSAATIGKALESLFDQDYRNFEVIVVMDGPDAEMDKALLEWKRRQPRIGGVLDRRPDIIRIPHAGACAARNAGAKHATGDYISFFSSDFIAEPGMLRRWIEAFEDNPDADMIYGGYRFWDMEGKPAMYSQPFDPYVLTCYPYIDGGFPVKADFFRTHQWDTDFKSLNDWEWILRMALDGMKAVFIPDFTYSAQSPRQGGLSDDSSRNWLERVAQIKKKHGIPDRPICFCSLDYPDEARKLALAMGQDVQVNPSFKPNTYKLVYMIGFNIQAANQCAEMLSVGEGATKVVHWMPGDVKKLAQSKIIDLQHLADGFREYGIKSFACTAEDVKFLQHYGFNVKLVYYHAWADQKGNGHDFKVWLPPGMEDVIKGMPDIPVTQNKQEATVEVLLDRPWGEVAGAQLGGKRVVSNCAYPGVLRLAPQKTYPEVKSALINLLRGMPRTTNGQRDLDTQKACNPRTFRRTLEALCR